MIFCCVYMILVVITNMNMYVEKDYDMCRLGACVLILFKYLLCIITSLRLS
jgi:hypothetical protein